MSGERDFNDLQDYLEGDTATANAAARRLDESALREGQISREDFERTWGPGSSRGIPSPF